MSHGKINFMQAFKDRYEAGRRLGEVLGPYISQKKDAIILALPRGGVPVAYEVAHALHLPLDILIVRKLGMPGYQELAIGAITSNGVQVIDQEVLNLYSISRADLKEVVRKEKEELIRREKLYRGDRSFPSLSDRTVILIDDGLATGSTMLAAIQSIRKKKPKYLMVAVPVASLDAYNRCKDKVDQMLCLFTPEPFYAVGEWYENFSQITDEEVKELLKKANVSLPFQ